jgi:glycerol-3-phosphate dehydrogenase
MFDFCIIGAGINGALIAHRLAHTQARGILLDQASDVANEATSANSAIIHSGHEPKSGTLKAQLNVRGAALWPDVAKRLQVEYQRCGAFVVATSPEERAQLKLLLEQAHDRGIPAQLLERPEALSLEPNLSDATVAVLDLPSTAIISPWEATIAACEEAVLNGVEIRLNHRVQAIEKIPDGYRIQTQHGSIETRMVINAAGVHADEIAWMVDPQIPHRIQARRGEYLVLDRSNTPVVSRVIYPVPSAVSKGVLVVPTVHGNVLIGPNAEPTQDKTAKDNRAEALNEVQNAAFKTVKNIPLHSVIRTYVGVRASLASYDFVIEALPHQPDFINLLGIDSPGLAAAPAIAEYVLERLVQHRLKLKFKATFIQRRAPVVVDRLKPSEKQALFAHNPRYGQMVCRCELISEAEVLDAIERPLGGHSLKALKRRVRVGAGRCQGGFCEPRVVSILAKSLGVEPSAVRYDGEGSNVLIGPLWEVPDASR